MFAKEGRQIILNTLIVSIAVTIVMLIFPIIFLKILAVVFAGAFFFTLWFFRDPHRKINRDNDVVVSPADGRVVAHDEIEDDFVGSAKLLSIFMSGFDVHVNRMPADVKIVNEEYTPGKFISAFNPSASFVNERRRIDIDAGGERKYAVTQIAGLMARRIVPYLSKGDTARKGDKIGMIKFGSKVDIVLPADIVVQVTLNQKLKAGQTVIGLYK